MAIPLEPQDDNRVRRLREDINELTAENRNLKRQADGLRKDLFESDARIKRLEKAAMDNANDVDDVPIFVDDPALKAARERVKVLEARLAQQTGLCKDALLEIQSASSEIEVARVVREDSAKAVASANRERDDAVKRAAQLEAALAKAQRALADKSKAPAALGGDKPATPIGPRNGLLTPDTSVRSSSQATSDVLLRDLQTRYDALLVEKRSVESKYLQLQRKWSDFKELVQARLSPSKPRRQGKERERASSPTSDLGDVSSQLGAIVGPSRVPNPFNDDAVGSPVVPVAPAIVVRQPTRTLLPITPGSPDFEIVASSETEDEDWDGKPPPSRTVTPAHAQVAPAGAAANATPSTPRRNRTFPSASKERETILVADSSPERPEPESQTQSQSSRGWSAPPESPVRPRVASGSRKRKLNELSDNEDPTPRKPAAPIDYSAFKGHGRYKTSMPQPGPSGKRINELYEINKEQNDGLPYQFDEVVRNKEKRRRLDGGDCECCKDYYEAIGPLPPRLQPPRWRSETPDSMDSQHQHRTVPPPGHRPCLREGGAGPTNSNETEAAAAIAAHKNEISRHRHQWAPAETPPDYWHIGFPTTQEVEEINRKAAIIHEQKLMNVAAEASKPNGKYKKKAR